MILASNKDDDHKLRELKNNADPQTKSLMFLFLESTDKTSNPEKSSKQESGEFQIDCNGCTVAEISQFSDQSTKESIARFMNAMASIKTGRDYICKHLRLK